MILDSLKLTLPLTGHCLLCGLTYEFPNHWCRPCIADLPWSAEAFQQCALPQPQDTLDSAQICARCLHSPPPFDFCFTPFYYRQPLDYLISGFKYRRHLI